MNEMTQPMTEDEVLKRITVDPAIFGGKPNVQRPLLPMHRYFGNC